VSTARRRPEVGALPGSSGSAAVNIPGLPHARVRPGSPSRGRAQLQDQPLGGSLHGLSHCAVVQDHDAGVERGRVDELEPAGAARAVHQPFPAGRNGCTHRRSSLISPAASSAGRPVPSRTVQDRTRRATSTVLDRTGRTRTRDRRLGPLVQHGPAALGHQLHPAGRVRTELPRGPTGHLDTRGGLNPASDGTRPVQRRSLALLPAVRLPAHRRDRRRRDHAAAQLVRSVSTW
jgi:hypothetical protein